MLLIECRAATKVHLVPGHLAYLCAHQLNRQVIWFTDEQETFADTVYVTRKIAKKGLENQRKLLNRVNIFIMLKPTKVSIKTNIIATAGIVANHLSFGELVF